ncbi:MAG: LPS export ABC transporter periplasmic protein LptC [Saprospiraceae bacterium]|nr:LPS export ABC transporter periplasmic protein LptC [Saprospiraceae bacterium]
MKIFSNFYVLILASFLWISCHEAKKELSDLEAEQLNNKESFESVNIRYSDSAEIQIRIEAPEMIRYIESGKLKEEFPKGFFAYFYQNGNIISNTLSSKYAIRVQAEGKTYMKDSVVFTSAGGELLKTAELIWNETNGRLFTDKFVRIIRKDEILQGYGFETDQNFREGTIKSIDAIIPSEKLFKED